MTVSLTPSAIKRFARFLIAACAISIVAACSSGVKLSDVAVEDKTGNVVGPVSSASAAGATGGAAGRTVQPVNIDGSQTGAAGPAGAAKVIYFDFDSYVVKPEFQGAMDAHAKFLAANKTRKMAIEGHADERGGREYNLALGQKRSEAVRRALAILGVPDTQVEAVSFGEEKPAKLGSDEESYSLNRRAEINYR